MEEVKRLRRLLRVSGRKVGRIPSCERRAEAREAWGGIAGTSDFDPRSFEPAASLLASQ